MWACKYRALPLILHFPFLSFRLDSFHFVCNFFHRTWRCRRRNDTFLSVSPFCEWRTERWSEIREKLTFYRSDESLVFRLRYSKHIRLSTFEEFDKNSGNENKNYRTVTHAVNILKFSNVVIFDSIRTRAKAKDELSEILSRNTKRANKLRKRKTPRKKAVDKIIVPTSRLCYSKKPEENFISRSSFSIEPWMKKVLHFDQYASYCCLSLFSRRFQENVKIG